MTFLTLAQEPATGNIVSTVWDMALKGGWSMIPLAICSLVAMTIVVERFLVTRRTRIAPQALLESAMANREDPSRILAACVDNTSPLALVLRAAARHADASPADQRRAIADAGSTAIQILRQRVRLLSSLPQAATMLGLLGTVLGMIRTFTVVAASGQSLGRTERLAQGIHEAWTATAGGLIIAIPTLIAYQIILARIDRAALALDAAANLWLDPPEPVPHTPVRVPASSRGATPPEPALVAAQ